MQMAAQPGIVRYEKHLLSTWDFATRGTRPFETLYEAVGRIGMSVVVASRVYEAHLTATIQSLVRGVC